MQRQIIVVSTADMLSAPLYASMVNADAPETVNKFRSFKGRATKLLAEREDFESKQERKRADGSVFVGQSNDFRHLREYIESDAALRMLFALGADLRSVIFPQSQTGGKSSSETSNLKSYKKAREIAECIYTGSGSLENVSKVSTVCAALAMRSGMDVLKRDFVECFLSSRLHSIAQGSADLWTAIDEVRAVHMTTGAQTQASQMIRQLVALKSAEDVREGREKNVRIKRDGLVFNALLKRLGQETFADADAA